MTAVEWLIDRLEVNKIIPNPYPGEYWNILKRGALEMEKQQIMNAWNNGFEENRPYVDHSEDYYNETFNKK